MTLPPRFQAAKRFEIPNALPIEQNGEIGHRLFLARDRFERWGDEDGREEFDWGLADVEQLGDPISQLRKVMLEQVGAACKAFEIEPFEPGRVAMLARLWHHGGHRSWHVETWPDCLPELQPRLFAYYWMASTPQMFAGGEVEFLCADMIAPRNNLLVFTDPTQARKIRPVECWSSHLLHGCWAITAAIGAK